MLGNRNQTALPPAPPPPSMTVGELNRMNAEAGEKPPPPDPSVLTEKGAGPVEPGTRGYDDLQDTFKALGIARPETKEEAVTAVKNILAGKNRTYNEVMTADPPSGYTARSEERAKVKSGAKTPFGNLAPPPVLHDFLSTAGDLPTTIYHGFQDVLGSRMQRGTERIGREAYEGLPPSILGDTQAPQARRAAVREALTPVIRIPAGRNYR
jgi:hypothetical protein